MAGGEVKTVPIRVPNRNLSFPFFPPFVLFCFAKKTGKNESVWTRSQIQNCVILRPSQVSVWLAQTLLLFLFGFRIGTALRIFGFHKSKKTNNKKKNRRRLTIHASPRILWAVLPTSRGSDWVCPRLGRLWSSGPGQFLGYWVFNQVFTDDHPLGLTSGNYADIHMSFKNVLICRNELKWHENVDKFLST